MVDTGNKYSGFQVSCPSTTPTELRMRLALSDVRSVFACFGQLLNLSPFKATFAFKRPLHFQAKPLDKFKL